MKKLNRHDSLFSRVSAGALALLLAMGTSAAIAAHKAGHASAAQEKSPAGGQGLKTRYQMANRCWAIQSQENGRFLVASGEGYSASAGKAKDAEPFYLKPTALGKYMLFPTSRQLLAITGDGIGGRATVDADDTVEWTVRAVGDATEYPPTPAYHVEPTPESVQLYVSFRDPNIRSKAFTIASTALPDMQLAVNADGVLDVAAADGGAGFSFVPAQGCAHFPEAESNFAGTPYRGKRADGTVLGHVDAHVHISSTEFLGGLQHGYPYHKFGVEHALSDCQETHGPNGFMDVVGGLFASDTDGHDTSGYPVFGEWPGAHMLTHEAIYWKWLERSWAAGLRIIVNDLVDNETLCELQREIRGRPDLDCDPMNNAGRQAGTMYGMMDYIDAQYGGRGEGFFQIVHDSAQARKVIEDGKVAVILGIEISNLFNCKVFFTPNPNRKEPFEEPMDFEPGENRYGCTQESMLAQMDRAWNWGVRQLITIHEFDNAFGGNGIFDGLILNLGSRENSGLNPSRDLQRVVRFLAAGGDRAAIMPLITNPQNVEGPTGEWWTTYDCPIEGETEGFSGYLWSSNGGNSQSYLSPPYCEPTGQGGRWGGATPCYPSGPVPNEHEGYRFSDYPPFNRHAVTNNRQCNARWMTPMGLFAYKKIMEKGFIFDWDHLEMGMKTQLLELAEAQDPPYPLVSTHGTFGGTTIDQAQRLLKAGGTLYPSNGSSKGFIEDMNETLGVHQDAGSKHLFGFGYGTDTNGLSGQTGPRGKERSEARPIGYEFDAANGVDRGFVLYEGSKWRDPMFSIADGVTFYQPRSTGPEGDEVVRTWHQDIHGNAHHGMLSDFVQEIALDGGAEHLQHLFNSAEVYLRMWAITETSSGNIRKSGGAKDPGGILRPAPGPQNDTPPAK